MKVNRIWVPSAFTLANVFCGYFSVISSINEKFVQAGWLIVAAAVLDALDGKIARFAKVDSRFGLEYDSLADVISFGFAPSILAYKAVFYTWGTIGLFISIGPLVFASIRLARFNVRAEESAKEFFEGLSSPTAAVTIATFLIFNYHFWNILRWEKIFLFIVIAVSILMVSSLKYESMPNFSLQTSTRNRRKIIVFVIGSLSVIIFPQEAFFPLSAAYAISGPVTFAWQVIRNDAKSQKKKNKDK
jgi:CDP-diacylglycerol--serine O-phosphatidyltransferase